jgi:GT2 family glycosyltransferase
MNRPDVSVVIVSYNTRVVTLACVRSVVELTRGCSFEVILVDNDSKDGTVEAIRAAYPQVTVIANEDNVGFARANNQGLEIATGGHLLLLNPDTEVNADTLSGALAHMERSPEVGLLGCRSFGADGKQQSTLFRYPRLTDVFVNVVVPNKLMRKSRALGKSRYVGLDVDVPQDVEVVAGCFMFLRREVYDQVGGMDGDFFMYGEEVEWCWRMHCAGWVIRYVPDVSILHYGGVSTAQLPTEMNLSMARGHLLVLQKIRGRGAAWVANLLMLVRDLPRVLLWAVLWPLRWSDGSVYAAGMRRAAGRWRMHLRGVIRLDWKP